MIRLDPAPEARWRRPGLRALLPRLARHTLASAVLLALASVATPPMLRAQTVPKFEILDSPIQLDGLARPRVYLGGVGRHAAFFGEETGSFEAWSWPVKLFHDFRLTFKIPDYTEPIPGASVARRVIVRPELMTVIYSHATFTVQQHFLVPLHEPGMIVLLDVSAVNALEIVASFRADLDLMWPAGIGGQYAYYDAGNRRFILSESRREYNAYVGSPFATEGSTHPAHATPDAPSVFRIAADTTATRTQFIPIVIAGGIMPRDSVTALYARLLERTEDLYAERVEHARVIREELASIRTPDPQLDLALEWAKVNLDEALACNPDLGCGLVAGYGPSGRGRRPGFGWFFGGDASINILGILPYGGFELARTGLDFQRRYRREDGKMPHEVTQSALRTREDWFTQFPYTYYHADTTPYWVVALYQYWLQTADTAFVRESWDAVVDAYRWGLANDSDGDLIVDNTAAGLGAVEVGELGAGLHQDIYLAAIWVESLQATAELAAALDETELAEEAGRNFERAQRNLELEYYIEGEHLYAFGVLEGGKTNPAITVWPAIALSFDLLDQERAGKNLDALASHRLASDWGTFMLARDHPLYDPLHYNMGAVWPFVTGFASWALYNYGRPHAGFAALWANAQSTFFDALGRNPELMSGAYHRTLDTSVPHQFFATSMIPTPLFRGLLGLSANAPKDSLEFALNLPADWDSLSVFNYPVGAGHLKIYVKRGLDTLNVQQDRPDVRATLTARFHGRGGDPLQVRFVPALPPGSEILEAKVNSEPAVYERIMDSGGVRPAVALTLDRYAKVSIRYRPGVDIVPLRPDPQEGAEASAFHILSYPHDEATGEGILRLEGWGGQTYDLEFLSPRGVPDINGQSGASYMVFIPDVSHPGPALREIAPGRYLFRVSFRNHPPGYVEREIRFKRR
jgi:glycogen debranching enzyme